MIVAPSILTADFTKLYQEIKKIETADYVHIDIMDGNFVPNISFGPAITKQISKISPLPLDVHLMVSKPMDWIQKFSVENVEFITVHIESHQYLDAIEEIKKQGKKVGISVKPNTSVEEIISVLNMVDLVLIMTVEPGFGGQTFMADMMRKVDNLKSLRKFHGYGFLIEVDGGINDKTIKTCKDADVDMVVAGSYVFNHENPKKAIESLK